MNGWQRWLQAPHTLPLRRALFQVHLWLGIVCGLYVLMISLTGSAIVLRPQIANCGITNSEGKPAIGSEQFPRVKGLIYE